MAFKIDGTVEIRRPLRDVGDFLAAPENDAKWQKGVVHLVRTGGDTGTVGATYERVQETMGRKIKSVQELVEHQPGRRIVFTTKGKMVELRSVYALADSTGGTRAQWTVEGELLGFAAMFEGVVAEELGRDVPKNLERLKSALEGAT